VSTTDPGERGAARPTDGAGLAITFLTILPIRIRATRAPLGSAAGWFPLVGAFIGAVAGGVRYGLDHSLRSGVASIIAVAALVILTGALHQDGLADCADGLGARGDRARRLEIMRDSSIGTFGALALGLWLLLMVSGLSELDRDDAFCALVVAAGAARWAVLLHAVLTQPARPDGLGRSFDVSRTALGVATLTTLVLAIALAGVGHGIAAVVAAALVALGVTAWSRSALGGRTGDTLGATVALGEIAVILVLVGLTN
jgi:adenosylcobinamide-GDP ribazoletransferase